MTLIIILSNRTKILFFFFKKNFPVHVLDGVFVQNVLYVMQFLCQRIDMVEYNNKNTNTAIASNPVNGYNVDRF